MWLLILGGGAIVVMVLGPLKITGLGELNEIVSSFVKAIVAIILTVAWIFILSKVKNWIFKKEIKK